MAKMKTREPLYPNFLISKRLEQFQQPPCQPPKGKDVLEHFFNVLYTQPRNKRVAGDAAFTVALELRDLWNHGDARIPLRANSTIKKAILEMREDLLFICCESKKKSRFHPIDHAQKT